MGHILTPTSGVKTGRDNWVLGDLITKKVFFDPSYGAAPPVRYTLTVNSGSSFIVSSSDGVVWNTIGLGAFKYLYSFAQGNGIYIGPSETTSSYAYSSDGLNYSLKNFPAPANGGIMAIAYGGGIFAAYDLSSPVQNVAISSDGINWTVSALTGITQYLGNTMYYLNGQFITVDSGKFFHSVDGIAWSVIAVSNKYWGSAAYGNGVYVIFASTTLSTGQPIDFAYSLDGVHWTLSTLPVATNNFGGVIFGGGIFLAFDVSSGDIFTSVDGINWTARGVPIGSCVAAFSETFGKFILASTVNTNFATSSDGISWSIAAVLPTAHYWATAIA